MQDTLRAIVEHRRGILKLGPPTSPAFPWFISAVCAVRAKDRDSCVLENAVSATGWAMYLTGSTSVFLTPPDPQSDVNAAAASDWGSEASSDSLRLGEAGA